MKRQLFAYLAILFLTVTVAGCSSTSSDSSDSSGDTTTTAPPSAPTGLNVTPGDGQNSLTWTGSTGATSYNIYWNTTGGVSASDSKIQGITTAPYVHTDPTATRLSNALLANGSTYYYAVSAVGPGGESGLGSESSGNPQVGAPGAPENLIATAGEGENGLQWDAVADATSYNLYWNTTGGVTTSDTKIAGATSPYNHTGLTNGTIYHYRTSAENAGGEGGLSNPAAAAPAITTTGVPTGLSVWGCDGTIKLNWQEVAGSSAYNVYSECTTIGTPAAVTTSSTKEAGITETSYSKTGLNDTGFFQDTCKFRVTALGPSGEGDLSTTVLGAPENGVICTVLIFICPWVWCS